MRISDWSSDVCSSDLEVATLLVQVHLAGNQVHHALQALAHADRPGHRCALDAEHAFHFVEQVDRVAAFAVELVDESHDRRSEEHTSELQSLMRISYAVFCLKKKKKNNENNEQNM